MKTNNGLHPEDAIYKVKNFINELQDIEFEKFKELTYDLNLTDRGVDLLHDYIFNHHPSEELYEDFEDYLNDFGVVLEEVVDFKLKKESITKATLKEAEDFSYISSGLQKWDCIINVDKNIKKSIIKYGRTLLKNKDRLNKRDRTLIEKGE